MNPILLDFPDSFDTERLVIRAPRPGDGAQVTQAVRESIDELRAWMPFAREEPTVEGNEAWVRQAAADWIARKDLPMLLFLKGAGALVGSSGLHRFDWDIGKFEIGYWSKISPAEFHRYADP